MLKLTQKGPNKIWHIEGRYRGVRIRESTQTRDRGLAEAARAKIETDLSHKSIFGAKPTCTFADAAEFYMIQGGERTFMAKLIVEFGKLKIVEITSAMVAKYAADTYPGRAPSYIVRVVYTPLHAAINAAAKAEMCDAKKFVKPKIQKRSGAQWMNDADLHVFLSVGCKCRRSRDTEQQRAVFLLMNFTGARDAEAIRLEWSDVDFHTGYITLQETKNGSSRRIAMASPVRAALLAMKPANAVGKIFEYSTRHSLIHAAQRACLRAGIEHRSPHEIGRHSFAARLLAQGKSVKFVAEAGGWKTYRIVAEIYGHMEQSDIDAFIALSGDTFNVASWAGDNVVPIKRTGTGE